MVSIGQARQQLQSQQRQVSQQIKQIESTKLPRVTRRALARATPQTQVKYKASLPQRKATLEKAKKEAISRVKEFERTKLGSYEKSIQTAEARQKVLEAEWKEQMQEEKGRQKAKKLSYKDYVKQQERIEAAKERFFDVQNIVNKEPVRVSAMHGVLYYRNVEGKLIPRTPLKGEDSPLSRISESASQKFKDSRQVEVPKFEQALPEVFQYQPSAFEKALGVSLEPTKIEPTFTDKARSFVKERVSIGPSGIIGPGGFQVELVKPEELVGAAVGLKEFQKKYEVTPTYTTPTIQELRGEPEYISPEKQKLTREEILYDVDPIITGPISLIKKTGGFIKEHEVTPTHTVTSLETGEVVTMPGVYISSSQIQETTRKEDEKWYDPHVGKITTKDIQQIPIVGGIEKGYQEELQWGKTVGQSIIGQEKLLEASTKKLDIATTFEEQEKILADLRKGGVKVDLKTDISTGEQYYDFQTTKPTGIIYKGFRDEAPTRTGFFLGALGKGYEEAGTAIAETKFQLEKGKLVSPWEKSLRARKGETYEYTPEAKIVGKGAGMLGQTQLYFVPGVGEAAFVAPFVEKGLESPFALKSYVKAHPYETAFAVGAVGIGVGFRAIKGIKTLKATKTTKWIEKVPRRKVLAKQKIDVYMKPKLKVIDGQPIVRFPLKTKAGLRMDILTPGRRYAEISKWDELFYKPLTKYSKYKKGKVVLEPKYSFFKPKEVKVLKTRARTDIIWGPLAGSKGRLKAIKGGLKTQRLDAKTSKRLIIKGKGKAVYYEPGTGVIPKGAGRKLKKFEIRKAVEDSKFLKSAKPEEAYIMLGKAKGQKVIRQPELRIDLTTKKGLVKGTVDYKPGRLGKLTEAEAGGASRKIGEKFLSQESLLDITGENLVRKGKWYDVYGGRTFAKDVTKAKPKVSIDVGVDVLSGKVKRIDLGYKQTLPKPKGKGVIIKEISYVGEGVKTKPFVKPSGEAGEEAVKMFRGGTGKTSSPEYIQSLYQDAIQVKKVLKEKTSAEAALKAIKVEAVKKVPSVPRPKLAQPRYKIDSSMAAPRMVGGEGKGVSVWYGVGREAGEEAVIYTTKAGGATITTRDIPQVKVDGEIRQSLVYGPGYGFDSRSDLKEYQTFIQPDIPTKQRQLFDQLRPQIEKEREREIQLIKQPQQIRELQKIKQAQVLKQKQLLKTIQIPTQVSVVTGFAPSPTPPSPPRPPAPTRPIKPIIPPIKPPSEFKPKKPRLPRKPSPRRPVFTSEVRRKGKWVAIGKFRTKKGAKAIAKRRAKRTAAASIRVKKNGKVVELKPSKLFRAAKKEPGVLVQKKTKRILSIGEKREISLIGARAAKAKKSKAKAKKKVKKK